MLFAATMLAVAITTPCTVVDGDTLRCGRERGRLLGIDAPDSPDNSRCRPYPKPSAICDRRLAAASKAALQRAISAPLSITRIGSDQYGRTLAMVYVRGKSLSCHQIEARQASYKPRWDQNQHVARECPRAIISY